MADAQRPDAAGGVFELLEELVVVGVEVLVDDDVDARVLGVLGHRDGSAAEDGYFGDTLVFDHGVEDAAADEASGPCEDEMHCDLG